MAENKRLLTEIIDLLHWKEYTFIGQDNAVFEGSLTQASEEQIATSILAKIREMVEGIDINKIPIPSKIWKLMDTEDRHNAVTKIIEEARQAILKAIDKEAKQ